MALNRWLGDISQNRACVPSDGGHERNRTFLEPLALNDRRLVMLACWNTRQVEKRLTPSFKCRMISARESARFEYP
jgi:hypothetical protein